MTLIELAEVCETIAKLAREKAAEGIPLPIPGPIEGPTSGEYPLAFKSAMVVLLQDEGGYDNDPDDPGGETNFGIDKRTYPDVDIANLTVEGATRIYFDDWWEKHGLGDMPPIVGAKMFNVGVNTGMFQAAKFLQRALGFTGEAVDGHIGPVTRTALAIAVPQMVLQSIRDQQAQFYRNLVERRPVLGKYLRGWLRRAAE